MKISHVHRMQKKRIMFAVRLTGRHGDNASYLTTKKPYKLILTDDGKIYEKVSRSDGYRVMVKYDVPDFFANIRVDKSLPGEFEDDKAIVIRYLQFRNENVLKRPENKFLQEGYFNDFESYSLNQDNLAFGEIGITVLFDDKNEIITTVYFLNQRPKYRKFSSLAEWKTLRAKMPETYAGCVRQNLEESAEK